MSTPLTALWPLANGIAASRMTAIGLIDYGAGNFGSVRNVLQYLEVDFEDVREPGDLERAQRLVLPGVGAFSASMQRLETSGMADGIREHVLIRKKPILGICVGMQLFAEVGYEFGVHQGFGFIGGSVERIDAESYGLPVPHMGWNSLRINKATPLLNGGSEPSFYFVHSYCLKPSDLDVVAASCEYGSQVPAVVQCDNVFGVQFHPEKSQRDGLLLLKTFSQL